jgi:hypothetical protein
MSPKHLACAAAAAMSLLTGAATAASITFQFSGTVVYGAPMAIEPGTPIVGIYSYDTDTAPAIKLKGYADYQISAPHGMYATVGGYSISSDNLKVTLWNDYKSNVEDMVQLSAGDVVVNGTAVFPDGALAIQLASAPHNRSALKDTKLPSQIDVEKFNADPYTYGFLQRDGAADGMLLQFTVDSIVVLE